MAMKEGKLRPRHLRPEDIYYTKADQEPRRLEEKRKVRFNTWELRFLGEDNEYHSEYVSHTSYVWLCDEDRHEARWKEEYEKEKNWEPYDVQRKKYRNRRKQYDVIARVQAFDQETAQLLRERWEMPNA